MGDHALDLDEIGMASRQGFAKLIAREHGATDHGLKEFLVCHASVSIGGR